MKLFNMFGVPNQAIQEKQAELVRMAQAYFKNLVDDGVELGELRAVASILSGAIDVACSETIMGSTTLVKRVNSDDILKTLLPEIVRLCRSDDRIPAIRIIRTNTDMGLKEAREYVDKITATPFIDFSKVEPTEFCDACGKKINKQSNDGGRCVKCGHMLCAVNSLELKTYFVQCKDGFGEIRAENKKTVRAALRYHGFTEVVLTERT